jgi:cation:H+ antiporter
MSGLPMGVLILIFAAAALATWVAGVRLASTTDFLDDHFGLGEALGGMILLSIVGSLPELAITVSAAASGDLGIAAGNLIGGVAMQTFVLVIADRCMRGDRPLSAAAASLVPALEGLLVIGVVAVAILSAVLPESANVGRLGAGEIAIVAIWLLGMRVLSRVRDRPELALTVPGDNPGAPTQTESGTTPAQRSTSSGSGSAAGAITVFAILAVVTLVAGVLLEQSGSALAADWGLNGVLFGATILAGATALPEISTGISGVRMQRYTLVYGDMFGGNAFQLTLFLIADLVAGQPVLPSESAPNAFIGGTGLVMTTVFVAGIILRPRRRHAGLGLDSWLVILVYGLGLWGLYVVTS